MRRYGGFILILVLLWLVYLLATPVVEARATGRSVQRAPKVRLVALRVPMEGQSITAVPCPRTPTPVSAPGGTLIATGYCSCVACCGKDNGITASGAVARWGTIAAPRGWAFGTRYTISGFGDTVFTVQDRGGSITGNRIDIWFPTHAEALAWGRRTVTLTEVK